jgi:hypothetical protein
LKRHSGERSILAWPLALCTRPTDWLYLITFCMSFAANSTMIASESHLLEPQQVVVDIVAKTGRNCKDISRAASFMF